MKEDRLKATATCTNCGRTVEKTVELGKTYEVRCPCTNPDITELSLIPTDE